MYVRMYAWIYARMYVGRYVCMYELVLRRRLFSVTDGFRTFRNYPTKNIYIFVWYICLCVNSMKFFRHNLYATKIQ